MAKGRRAETGTAPGAGDPFHASFLDRDRCDGTGDRRGILMVVIATDFKTSRSSTSLDDRKGVCGNSTPPCTPETTAPVEKLVDSLHLKCNSQKR